MNDPTRRLVLAVQALARPVAVAIATGCEEPLTFSQLGARVRRGESSVRATLQELLNVGAIAKPEGAYLATALEAGELRCTIPALLRGLADEIEVLP